jgi:hypothetical protein
MELQGNHKEPMRTLQITEAAFTELQQSLIRTRDNCRKKVFSKDFADLKSKERDRHLKNLTEAETKVQMMDRVAMIGNWTNKE